MGITAVFPLPARQVPKTISSALAQSSSSHRMTNQKELNEESKYTGGNTDAISVFVLGFLWPKHTLGVLLSS